MIFIINWFDEFITYERIVLQVQHTHWWQGEAAVASRLYISIMIVTVDQLQHTIFLE